MNVMDMNRHESKVLLQCVYRYQIGAKTPRMNRKEKMSAKMNQESEWRVYKLQ